MLQAHIEAQLATHQHHQPRRGEFPLLAITPFLLRDPLDARALTCLGNDRSEVVVDVDDIFWLDDAPRMTVCGLDKLVHGSDDPFAICFAGACAGSGAYRVRREPGKVQVDLLVPGPASKRRVSNRSQALHTYIHIQTHADTHTPIHNHTHTYAHKGESHDHSYHKTHYSEFRVKYLVRALL